MLNRKLIGLLALLLSAGLSLSACGDDDAGSKDNNASNNNQADAGGSDTTGGGDEDAGDTAGEADTTDPETGCTVDSCAAGYECNTTDSVCVPAASGCELTGADRPERCDEATAGAEFGPASLVTEFQIASDADDCCFDFNGDDNNDNALSMLESLPGDINGGIQDSIDSGRLVLIFEHDGLDDLVDSSPYTLNVWLGESVEAPVEGPFVIDPTSVDQGTFPQASLPNAQIVGGVLTAGPGVVDINVTLEGLLDAPLGLRISQAQIEATVDASSSSLEDGVVIKNANPALTGGKLGGAIRVDDLVSAMNSFTSGSCECLGLAAGADYILADGNSLTCATLDPETNTCEADGNSTCSSLSSVCSALPLLGALVDVDTDGDGEDDALSIGTTFNTKAATISGIGTAE